MQAREGGTAVRSRLRRDKAALTTLLSNVQIRKETNVTMATLQTKNTATSEGQTRHRSIPDQLLEIKPKVGIRLADHRRIGDRDARPAQPDQGHGHGDPVITVGLDDHR